VPLWHFPPYGELLQSPSPLHPHTPPLHLVPSGELEQSVAHVPPEQHPPWHCAAALHEVEQVPPLQAVPMGQSPVPLHPHEPLLRHWLPVGAVEQSTQLPPGGAHAELAMPVHCPALQQKPLSHVPSEPPPQEALQVPPAPHVGVWPPHPPQASPFVPHASFAPPATHVPAWQQPPLQRTDAPQAVEHVPPLHPMPIGQSPGPVQWAPVSTLTTSAGASTVVPSCVASCAAS
jgi:hypothetical protein